MLQVKSTWPAWRLPVFNRFRFKVERRGEMEEKMIEVKLVRSGVNRPETQQRTLRGLGLTRMNRTVRLKDTEAIRGMVRKVIHLVKVVEK